MAERFNLTAQLQLQAPTNTQQVVGQIRRQLQGINVNVAVKGNVRQVASINKELQNVNRAAKNSAKSVGNLNRTLADSARRFSVITIATGSFLSLARAIKNSVGSAVQFQREMVRISQVTGQSLEQLEGISKEVTRLSTQLGVANRALLETSRVLAQAGFNARQVRESLDILAKTTLAPTFDNIKDTTEGAIALLRQFGKEATRTGTEIQFLEQSLDAINAVSKRFAVESSDLITAVRRTGGVFEAAGGNINELIALFTSVRSTTRESAETIATGFRTIFTRLQRTETIDQLRELGITLQDTEGKFIGPLAAVEALSVGLAGLDPKDFRFNQIVEQLGGFRQIGKVIPLIKEFATTQNALNVALSSGGSVAQDAETAQQALAVQFEKVGQQFDALIRKFAASEGFGRLAKFAIDAANAFLKFAEVLEDLLPQLAALAAIRIGRGIAPGVGALLGGRGARRNSGGMIHGFSGGGFVPGKGNYDTVPAMLTPGEFVVKKSSAQKLGAGTLQAMNNNRYAGGGYVSTKRLTSSNVQGGTTIANALNANRGKGWSVIDEFKAPYNIKSINPFGKGVPKKLKQQYQNQPTASKRGIAFEKIVAKRTGVTLNKGNAFLDTKRGEIKSDKSFAEKKSGGLGSKAYKTVVAKALNTLLMTKTVDQLGFTAKKDKKDLSAITVYTDPSISQWENNRKLIAKGKEPEGLNKGGGVSGSDSVPALLTPGEFVVKKSAAQSIGYSNLSKMNQSGVARFAAGGVVEGGRNNYGLLPPGVTNVNQLPGGAGDIRIKKVSDKVTKSLDGMQKAAQKSSKEMLDETRARDKSQKEIDEEATARDRNTSRQQRASGLANNLNKMSGIVGGASNTLLTLSFAAGPLIQSMGGLTDAQKQQTQAFISTFAVYASLGTTLLQMASSGVSSIAATVANTAAKSAETVSTEANTVADTKNTTSKAVNSRVTDENTAKTELNSQAKGKASLASSAVGVAMGVATVAVIAFALAQGKLAAEQQKFKTAIQTANANAEKFLQDFEKTGQIDEGAFIAARTDAAMADLTSTILGSKAAFLSAETAGTALAGGLLTAGSVGVVALTAFGTVLSGGTLLIAGVVGAIAGAVFGFSRLDQKIKQFTAEIAEASKPIIEASALRAQAELIAIKSIYNFDDSLRQAKASGFSASQTLDVLASGVSNLSDSYKTSSALLTEAAKKAEAGMADLVFRGLVAPGGGIGPKLAEADLGEADKAQFKELIKGFKEVEKQRLNAEARVDSVRIKALQQESATRQQSVAATGKAINDAIESGDFSDISDILDPATGDLKKGIEAITEVLKFETLAREEAIQRLQDQFAIAFGGVQNIPKGTRDQISSLRGLESDRSTQRQNEATLSAELASRKQAQAALASALTIVREEQARRALLDVISQNDAALRGFNNFLFGASGTLVAMESIDPQIAIGNFEVPKLKLNDTAVFDIPLQQIDGDILNKNLDAAISLITSNPNTTKATDDLFTGVGQTVKDAKAALDVIPQELGTLVGSLGENVPNTADLLDNLLNAAGLTQASPIADILKTQLQTLVGDGGTFDAEALENFQSALNDVAGAGLETAKKIFEVQNKYLSDLDRINAGIVDAQTRLQEAQANVIDVRERGRDRVAEATGIPRDRRARERGRLDAARARVGAEARGAGVRVGDVAATGKALKDLTREARVLDLQQRKNGTLTEAEIARRHTLNKAMQEANSELERMADQSARASDVMSDIEEQRKVIDEERAKREQGRGLVEDFVAGDAQARSDINRTLNNIGVAISQGNLAGSTADQRQEILGMLDQLSDVEIRGSGGLTGSELKDVLVRAEAARIGVDPALLSAIYDGTTKEQDALNKIAANTAELRNIGAQEEAAAQALADAAEVNVTALEVVRDYIQQNFAKDVAKALNEASAEQEADAAKRGASDKDLQDRATDLQTQIDDNNKAIETLETALEGTRAKLAELNPKIAELNQALSSEAAEVYANTLKGINTAMEKLAKENKEFFEGGTSTELQKQTAENIAETVTLTGQSLKENIVTPLNNLAKQQQEGTLRAGKGFGEAANKIVDASEQTVEAADGLNKSAKNISNAAVSINQAASNLSNASGGLINGVPASAYATIPSGNAQGGMIYKAAGGSIFKPKGTDTVPAMLTPGEFVIKKSSVDKIGAGTLQQLNSGNVGAVQGFAGGGFVGPLPAGVTHGDMMAQQRQEERFVKVLKAVAAREGVSVDKLRETAAGTGAPIGGDPFADLPTNFQSAMERLDRIFKVGFQNGIANQGLTLGSKPQQFYKRIAESKAAIAASQAQTEAEAEAAAAADAAATAAVQPNAVIERARFLPIGLQDKLRDDAFGLMPAGYSQTRRIGGRRHAGDIAAAAAQAIGLDPTFPRALARLAWEAQNSTGFYDNEAGVIKGIVSGYTGQQKVDFFKGVYGSLPATLQALLLMGGGGAAGPGGALAVGAAGFPAPPGAAGPATYTYSPAQSKEKILQQLQRDVDRGALSDTARKRFIKAGIPQSYLQNKSPELNTMIEGFIAAARNQTQQYITKKLENPAFQTDQGKRDLLKTFVQQNGFPRFGMSGVIGVNTDAGGPVPVRVLPPDFGVRYFQSGGSVEDTVPAMLTPGEFVMNKAAVQKHGVGFMKNLNRGRVPGFNRGGIVGHGNVAYKQNGGSIEGNNGVLQLDPSLVDNVLKSFSATFKGHLDGLTRQISGLSSAISALQYSFSNMHMTHNFQGDMTLAFSITNSEELKSVIGAAIAPKIGELIAANIDGRLGSFNATGSDNGTLT